MFPMQGVPPLLRKRKHEDLPRTVPSTSLNAYLLCCKHTPFSRQIKTWEYLLIKRCFLNHYPSQGALCSQWNCRPETSIFTLEAWGKWPSHTLLIGTKLQPLEEHSLRSGRAGVGWLQTQNRSLHTSQQTSQHKRPKSQRLSWGRAVPPRLPAVCWGQF